MDTKLKSIERINHLTSQDIKYYINREKELNTLIPGGLHKDDYKQAVIDKSNEKIEIAKNLEELFKDLHTILTLRYEAQDQLSNPLLTDQQRYYYGITAKLYTKERIFSLLNNILTNPKEFEKIRKTLPAPSLIQMLSVLEDTIKFYQKELQLGPIDILSEYQDNFTGMINKLNIINDLGEESKDALAESIITAIPLKVKGILPAQPKLSQIISINNTLTENILGEMKDNLGDNLQYSIQLFTYLVGQKDAKIASLLTKQSFDIGIKKFARWLEKSISFHVAPAYVETVKLIDRSKDGKEHFEVWIPMNRLDVYLTNGKYGFKLRDVGRQEARHEVLGHLFGLALGIPLGETRDDTRGYNETEVFAQTFTAFDTIFKAKERGYLTPDEFTYLKVDKTTKNIFNKWQRFVYWFKHNKDIAREPDVYNDFMRGYYGTYYSGNTELLKKYSEDAFKLLGLGSWFNKQGLNVLLHDKRYSAGIMKQFEKWSKDIKRTLAQGEGTTSLAKEWMQLDPPILSSIYPNSYWEIFHPANEGLKSGLLKTSPDNLSTLGGTEPPEFLVDLHLQLKNIFFDTDNGKLKAKIGIPLDDDKFKDVLSEYGIHPQDADSIKAFSMEFEIKHGYKPGQFIVSPENIKNPTEDAVMILSLMARKLSSESFIKNPQSSEIG